MSKKPKTKPKPSGKLVVLDFRYDLHKQRLQAFRSKASDEAIHWDEPFKPGSARQRKQFLDALEKKGLHLDRQKNEAEILKKAAKLAQDEPPPAEKPALQETLRVDDYFVADNCIYHDRCGHGGKVSDKLSNFDARIIEQAIHDDGVEQTPMLAIEGTLYDKTPLPRIEVSVAKFNSMDWPMQWGIKPVVSAGLGLKDHMRVAMHLFSGNAPRRTVYTHLGWIEVDGKALYMHAGGAIGASGATDEVLVSPPESLRNFRLPPPPPRADLANDYKAVLALLKLAPLRVAVPVVAAVFRAVLGETDFSLYVTGQSGGCKSELVALAQQFFGPEMKRTNLPCAWTSTENYLEAQGFHAKDALIAIDDFIPGVSKGAREHLHAKADRVLRSQGNGSGRGRCNRESKGIPSRPPRGLFITSGEDVPMGASLQARLFIVEIARGDICRHDLTPHQNAAKSGTYARVLSGFLQWLAPRLKQERAALDEELDLMRKQLGDIGHSRTPTTIAMLVSGWGRFLRFGVEEAGLDAKEAEQWGTQGRDAIVAAAKAQAGRHRQYDPAESFVRLLGSCLRNGQAHVTDRLGGEPANPNSWGWWLDAGGARRPQGKRVGWLIDGELHLDPEAAFAEAQSLSYRHGESLTVTMDTVWRRMKDAGLTVCPYEDRTKDRPYLGDGSRPWTIHVKPGVFGTAGGDAAEGKAE